jgi:hypothetical protein
MWPHPFAFMPQFYPAFTECPKFDFMALKGYNGYSAENRDFKT